MPIRFDLKTIPEVAALPIEQGLRIERRSLFLAAWDWRTLLTLPLLMVCLVLADYVVPEGGETICAIALGVGCLALYLSIFLVRANHHAVQIARHSASLTPQVSPLVPLENHPPVMKIEALSGWRKAASLVGLGAGLYCFYLGTATPRWYMLGVAAIMLVLSGILGTSWIQCRSCQHLTIGLWSRTDRCALCRTSFREKPSRG